MAPNKYVGHRRWGVKQRLIISCFILQQQQRCEEPRRSAPRRTWQMGSLSPRCPPANKTGGVAQLQLHQSRSCALEVRYQSGILHLPASFHRAQQKNRDGPCRCEPAPSSALSREIHFFVGAVWLIREKISLPVKDDLVLAGQFGPQQHPSQFTSLEYKTQRNRRAIESEIERTELRRVWLLSIEFRKFCYKTRP